MKDIHLYDVSNVSDDKRKVLDAQSIIDHYVRQTGQKTDKMNAFDWYSHEDYSA